MKEDDLRAMQRHLAKRAIDPIKSMVLAGMLDPQTAMGLVLQATGGFDKPEFSRQYASFRENMSKLFEGEVYFDSGYQSGSANGFPYRESSFVDAHFLYKIYQHLSGANYRNPDDLRDEIAGILKGKKLLEIGCGPGFGLKVFQNLGADVVGVELRDKYKGRIPGIDIRYGSAADLDDLCKEEQFDLIYSNDLFSTACVTERDSNQIARQMYKSTKQGGLGFYLLAYQNINPVVYDFGNWLEAFQRGQDLEAWEEWYERIPDEERDEMSWTNKCSLDPQYLLRSGFKMIEYGVEDQDLIMITKK